MIRLYSGTPGSGKSLHNARDIIVRSQLGEPVIGNFECDLRKYKRANYTYCPNDQLTPRFLMEYSRQHFKGRRPGAKDEGAILLVIDECQLLFNSREWQRENRNQWLEFFTQHRKFGYNITLIAQFDRMIDRQIRSLIEYEFIHRKLSNFGFKGFLLSLVLGGNTFVAVQMWYPLKERIGSEFIHARKKLWSIYDSYALFVTDGEGEGLGVPCPAPAATDSAQESSDNQKRFHWRHLISMLFHRDEPKLMYYHIPEKYKEKLEPRFLRFLLKNENPSIFGKEKGGKYLNDSEDSDGCASLSDE